MPQDLKESVKSFFCFSTFGFKKSIWAPNEQSDLRFSNKNKKIIYNVKFFLKNE